MNSTTKTILVAAVVALVVSLTAWGLSPAKKVGTVSFGNTSTDGSQAALPTPSNFDYLVARLSLGLGTNLSNSNTGAGNVNITAQRMNIVAATTTPCAIQNPLNATSTLSTATINVTTGTSTVAAFIVSTSTTAFAATSPVYSATLAANTTGTLSAGDTASTTGLGIVLGPTSWVVWTLPSANTLVGTCSAVFQSV